MNEPKRAMSIPTGSEMAVGEYRSFLKTAYHLLSGHSLYFASGEDIESLELAHLLPSVKETVLALYIGINDTVCNKGIVTQFLPRHGHNNVFVFDSQIYTGGKNVPTGTVDVKTILNGFDPPNESWDRDWTYVMIDDPTRSFSSLWDECGYIDMIPAKFEDFTMLSDLTQSKVCIFIDAAAFEHPVNQDRKYLRSARNRGEKMHDEFEIPDGIRGESDGLIPVVLDKGEKLYVATKHFGPCAHAWSNIHPDNKLLAVVNENSAVPLDLIVAKPPVKKIYAQNLVPPRGSADLTTDWFYRGRQIVRNPLLYGLAKG